MQGVGAMGVVDPWPSNVPFSASLCCGRHRVRGAAVGLCDGHPDPCVAEQGEIREVIGSDPSRREQRHKSGGFGRGVSIAAHHAEANGIRWCVFNNTINLRR